MTYDEFMSSDVKKKIDEDVYNLFNSESFISALEIDAIICKHLGIDQLCVSYVDEWV